MTRQRSNAAALRTLGIFSARRNASTIFNIQAIRFEQAFKKQYHYAPSEKQQIDAREFIDTYMARSLPSDDFQATLDHAQFKIENDIEFRFSSYENSHDHRLWSPQIREFDPLFKEAKLAVAIEKAVNLFAAPQQDQESNQAVQCGPR